MNCHCEPQNGAPSYEEAFVGKPANANWHPNIRKLYDYWMRLPSPGEGRLPNRGAFDPLDIFPLLPFVWMVDIQRDPLRFKFRLVGTEHVNVMGFDPTNMWIDEAYPGFENSPSFKDYQHLAEQGEPNYRKGAAHYHVACHKEIERIMLPLGRDVPDQCDIILALTVYN